MYGGFRSGVGMRVGVRVRGGFIIRQLQSLTEQHYCMHTKLDKDGGRTPPS